MTVETVKTLKYICDGNACGHSFTISANTLETISTQKELDNIITNIWGFSIADCGTTIEHYCYWCATKKGYPIAQKFDIRSVLKPILNGE